MQLNQAKKSPVRPPDTGQAAIAYLTPSLHLIRALRDNPLAIGVLLLIMRLYVIYQEAIPVSAADFATLDPSITASAGRRAIKRSVGAGGLTVHKRKGMKYWYVPNWGTVRGKVREWDAACKMFNRPHHLAVLKFDARIFDYFMGRIVPDQRLPACVERYVSQPALKLQDVGNYALVLAGFTIKPNQMKHLAHCGLIRDGKPCPLPIDGNDVLRWISQARLFDDKAPILTDKGLRRLGIDPQPASEIPAATGQPLVYIEQDQLAQFLPHDGRRNGSYDGHCNGHRDGYHDGHCDGYYDGHRDGYCDGLDALKMGLGTGDLAALEADKSEAPVEPENGTWSLKHLKHKTIPPSQAAGFSKKTLKRRTKKPVEPLPTTPTAELLRKIGVYPSSISELYHIDFKIVSQIHAYSKTRSEIRDPAAWLVRTLRDYRDNGSIPTAPVESSHPLLDLDKYITGKFAPFFNHGEPDEATEALAAQPENPPTDRDPRLLDLDKYTTGKFAPFFNHGEPDEAAEMSASEPKSSPKDTTPPDVLMGWIRRCLYGIFRAEQRPLADQLRLVDTGDVPIFGCATAETLAEWEDGLAYCLNNICRKFGWRQPPSFVLDDAVPADGMGDPMDG